MTPEQKTLIEKYRAHTEDHEREQTEKNITRYIAGEITLDCLEYAGIGLDTVRKARDDTVALLDTITDQKDRDALLTNLSKLEADLIIGESLTAKPIFVVHEPEPTNE